VEHGSVVPESVLARRCELCDVSANQCDARGRTQAQADMREGGVCDVQDGEVAEAPLEQAIDKQRGATPNVDDGIVRKNPGRLNERDREGGIGLVPAHLVRLLLLIDPLPVRSTLCAHEFSARDNHPPVASRARARAPSPRSSARGRVGALRRGSSSPRGLSLPFGARAPLLGSRRQAVGEPAAG